MKKLIFTILLGLSTNLFAETVYCQAKLSTQTIWETKVELNSQKVKVGEVEHYQIFLKQNSNNYSLEIYDPMTPSRQYAEGSLEKGLSWALWTRDILLEVKCEK